MDPQVLVVVVTIHIAEQHLCSSSAWKQMIMASRELLRLEESQRITFQLV